MEGHGCKTSAKLARRQAVSDNVSIGKSCYRRIYGEFTRSISGSFILLLAEAESDGSVQVFIMLAGYRHELRVLSEIRAEAVWRVVDYVRQ